MNRDRITGILAILVAAAYAFMTSLLPATNMKGDPGPKVFPFIAAALIGLSGLSLVLRKPRAGRSEPYFNPKAKTRFLLILGMFIFYVAAMYFAGFIPATLVTLFVFCTMFVQAGETVPVWHRAVFTVAVTFLIYYIFNDLLKLPLPAGKIFQ